MGLAAGLWVCEGGTWLWALPLPSLMKPMPFASPTLPLPLTPQAMGSLSFTLSFLLFSIRLAVWQFGKAPGACSGELWTPP